MFTIVKVVWLQSSSLWDAAIDAFLGAFAVGSTLAVCTSTSLTHTRAAISITLVSTLAVRALAVSYRREITRLGTKVSSSGSENTGHNHTH